MQLLSRILIIIGFFSIGFGLLLVWERNKPNRLAFANYDASNYAMYDEYPVSIRIPSIAVELPIEQSAITNNTWTTSHIGVSYLTTSPLPGTWGNSILYGHNWNNILGSLKDAKPGDEIQIKFNTGTKRRFIINTMGTVTPDQTHVLLPSNDVRITLYTCSGFLDNKRLVVTATLSNTISANSTTITGGITNE